MLIPKLHQRVEMFYLLLFAAPGIIRNMLQLRLLKCFAIMLHVYISCNHFKVHSHFETYAKKVDQIVEEALRSNIKQCMTQLCRAVSGDNKTSPSPLFKVLVTLRQASPNATPKVQAQSLLAQAGHVIMKC